MNFQEKLRLYAKTAVRVGVNLKPNQDLVVNASVECLEVARLVVEEAYEAGAKTVTLKLLDDYITYLRYKKAPDTSFEDEVPPYQIAESKYRLDNKCAFLTIKSTDPELLKDCDPKRVSGWSKKMSIAMEENSARLMNNESQWLVLTAPTKSVSTLIFPNETPEKAMELHWEEIFKACRIDTPDPVVAWKEHQNAIHAKVDWLNEMNFDSLQFVNSDKSTNINIGLVKNHVWAGAGDTTVDGHPFMPNLPTEESFCMPDSQNVNGVVKSTKPLNYQGNLIDNFTLTFKDGKVVDFTAETGYEALKNMLDADEGARRIGEVALVPDDSPISNSGLIFYNTLFDENASCHLALGRAYPTNIKGGSEMSKEELIKNNANSSIIHVDFMIGSADLNITGIKSDGKEVPVFVSGNWA
ncbi:MAG: aminopeptidase [Lachnospirales bacterium]